MQHTPAEARIAALAAPVVAAQGRALVAVRVTSGTVQIFAEDPATRNLGVDDCAALSRALSPVLEAAAPMSGPWRLEVSSPGADRPLARAQDFADFAGREAKIELAAPDAQGQKRFRGTLQGMEGDTVRIETEGREVALPLAAISKARLIATT
jgi:ribosome maturation factor RimP